MYVLCTAYYLCAALLSLRGGQLQAAGRGTSGSPLTNVFKFEFLALPPQMIHPVLPFSAEKKVLDKAATFIADRKDSNLPKLYSKGAFAEEARRTNVYSMA